MQIFDTFRSLVGQLTGKPGGDAQRAGVGLVPLNAQELLVAFRTDWLVRKIITVPAWDMTREWRAWQAEDDQIEKIEEEERRLGVQRKTYQAKLLARLFGGAGLLIGTGEANAGIYATELDPESIQAGGIKWLAPMHRHQLMAGDLQANPALEFFQEPEFYTLQTNAPGLEAGLRVHPSRVIRFTGADVPPDMAPDLGGWGDPVLENVRRAVYEALDSHTILAGLLDEAKTDVVTVTGLMERVATQDYRDRLTAKWQLAATLKKTMGVLMMDASEKWEQRQLNFQNLDKVVAVFVQAVCGAADIPATRLWGKSPDGMNSTGDSDLRNHYDSMGAQQRVELQPSLSPLDEMLIRSALGARPPTVHYTWRPLWQPSQKEQAETAYQKAQATKIYADLNVLPRAALAKAVQNQLVEDSIYPGLEDALAEAEAAGEVAPFEDPASDPANPLHPDNPANPANRQPAGTPGQEEVAGRRPVMQRAANDAKPRTLYVSRRVLNGEEIRAWARGQGIKSMLPLDQLHVTEAFSRTPVNWATMPAQQLDTVTLEGADRWRYVTKLGDDGALVLMLDDDGLTRRWQQFVDAGASWDYDGYRPHVTLTYSAGYLEDTWALTAYQGVIILGPEEWSEIKPGTGAGITEVSTEDQA